MFFGLFKTLGKKFLLKARWIIILRNSAVFMFPSQFNVSIVETKGVQNL
jgi:hypothetical protein